MGCSRLGLIRAIYPHPLWVSELYQYIGWKHTRVESLSWSRGSCNLPSSKTSNFLDQKMQRTSVLFTRASRALDRVGLTVSPTKPIQESFARHRSLMNVFNMVSIQSQIPKLSIFYLSWLISEFNWQTANFDGSGVLDCPQCKLHRKSFSMHALIGMGLFQFHIFLSSCGFPRLNLKLNLNFSLLMPFMNNKRFGMALCWEATRVE